MRKELKTVCDSCGREIKVVKDSPQGNTVYMVHGLFCINLPGFFCSKECFNKTLDETKHIEYIDRDDEGKTFIDVDVMIDETLILDKMYDMVYEVDNPLFPTLVFQRLLSVDPENAKFLYGLSSLYAGLLSAKNTPPEWKPKLTERLNECEEDLKRLSTTGYQRLQRLREHFNV
jgi:hypothetical protein